MADADELYQKLIEHMKMYHPYKDFSLVEKAYQLAKSAHIEQKRKSGEPYIIHPLEVALVLSDLELDIETVVAGILHDVIEDTVYTYDDLCNLFSEEIAALVDGVTKLGNFKYSTANEFSKEDLREQKEELQADNYRKMFLAMAKDIRVILIKLADRLHNMRTLKHMPSHKQEEKAQETLDIYAPLSHRLGISKIQKELEDLSLRFLNPDAYFDLVEKIKLRQKDREDYVDQIVAHLKVEFTKRNINARVEGRPKHFFSIYKKMLDKDKTLDQIYDLIAVRIIVDSIADCYAVLGVVHELYKPLPGRFKDYIAVSKPNMYRSLHDSLIGPSGDPFEVQIRTWEMHKTAEYGIAAHWRYKETKPGHDAKSHQNVIDSAEAKLNWLKEILDWQKELSNNKEFMDVLKSDLDVYKDDVYAFTPKGEVINMPKGSTPIDFAYMIHSAVGNKMVGAKVNGKIVTFDYQINNGDRIDIITSQNSRGPSRDWLKLVKSPQAKNKINQWYRNEFKEENIVKGKDLIEKYIKKKGFSLTDLLRNEWIELVAQKYGFKNWDAICAAIGHGGLKEGQVVNRLYEEYLKEMRKSQTAIDILKENANVVNVKNEGKSEIIIKGIGDTNVRYPKCCNPLPGDDIVGFVTRGRGVTVHRTDCSNIVNMENEETKRLINVEWRLGNTPKTEFLAELSIIGEDRLNMITDISVVFNDFLVPVKSLNLKSIKNKQVSFNIVIAIKNIQQLEKIINKIKTIKGVYDIGRVSGG